MSGFEVAGIVLGSIPILLASLKLGGDAVQSTKRLFGYKAVIIRYQTILEAEAVTYRNILLFILKEVATPLELDGLLEDPGGKAWKDEAFIERLKEKRLGDSYNAVIGIMREMDNTIREFSDKIGARQTPQGQGKRLALKIITYQSALDGFVENLAGHNRRLETLAKLAVPIRIKPKTSKLFVRLENFRSQALALYRAVQKTLTCICQSHDAAIVLDDPSHAFQGPFTMLFSKHVEQIAAPAEWYPVAAELLPKHEIAPAISPCNTTTIKGKGKKVAFQTPSSPSVPLASLSISATTIGSLVQASHSSSYTSIDDFCQHLHMTRISTTLPTPGKISDIEMSFSVAMSKALLLDNLTMPSFQSWLNTPRGIRLSLRDRMLLAVSISTAVVGLCQTPWCPKQPQKDQILLVKPGSSNSTKLGLLAKLKPGLPTVPSSESAPRFIKHPTFFMLGILLIELIFGTSLEQLYDQVGYSAPSRCSRWQELFDVADLLLEKGHILDEGGQNYESAVHSCIHGDFQLPGLKSGVDDKALRQSVYENVVTPLDENMMAFKLKMSK